MTEQVDANVSAQDILSVIEGRYQSDKLTRSSHKSLFEEHFSNILAWLFDPSAAHGLGCTVLSALLMAAGASRRLGFGTPKTIQREFQFALRNGRRRGDILVTFANSGPSIAVEVKTDRTYEDPQQLRDYRQCKCIGDDGLVILLCPRDVHLLTDETRDVLSEPHTAHATWAAFLEQATDEEVMRNAQGAGGLVLASMKSYFKRRQASDFKWMAERLLEETGWESFYPDDFKEEFIRRYKPVYDMWVAKFGERGNGGAHQRLTSWLVAQSNPRSKGRLFDRITTAGRPPKDPDWGFHVIYKYVLRRHNSE